MQMPPANHAMQTIPIKARQRIAMPVMPIRIITTANSALIVVRVISQRNGLMLPSTMAILVSHFLENMVVFNVKPAMRTVTRERLRIVMPVTRQMTIITVNLARTAVPAIRPAGGAMRPSTMAIRVFR